MATDPMTRRDFVKGAGSAVAAASVLGVGPAAAQARRRRYAIVGTGDRATGMWGRPLVNEYSDVVEFVGLCDINPKRAEASRQMIGVACPTFTSVDEMLDRARPDLLMVATVDAFHSQYIVKARDRGLSVMTEKSCLTGIAARKSIDERRAVRIADLVKFPAVRRS